MYNENDEMYEVNDYDEDIKQRQALLLEAKALIEAGEEATDFRSVMNLKRKWKRIGYWDSAFEETLSDEFEGYMDTLYGKRNEGYQSNQAAKQALIEQANKAAESDQWNQATEEMNELMQQWRASGSTGSKESDDALWESFNSARTLFFDRKNKHWEELKQKFGNAREVKRNLIEQAQALAQSEDWNKTSDAYRKLMDEWKAAGSAGREHEDKLWDEFHAIRQKFYDRRNEYYEQMRGEQDQKYSAKKALIERAEEIVKLKEYTKEHTAAMKELNVEWKNIGSCGRDKEDAIWNEFRGIMDSYFHGLKQMNEQKHAQWRQRMQEMRTRKMELIQDQKRQIKHMEDEMIGLLGQRAIDEMEERIDDKQDFIEELEEQLAELDAKLQQ